LSSRFYRTALNFPHPSYPKSRTPYQLPTAGPTCHTLLFPSLPTPPTISLSPLVHSPPHPLPTTGSLPSICGGAGLPRRSSKARRRPLPPFSPAFKRRRRWSYQAGSSPRAAACGPARQLARGGVGTLPLPRCRPVRALPLPLRRRCTSLTCLAGGRIGGRIRRGEVGETAMDPTHLPPQARASGPAAAPTSLPKLARQIPSVELERRLACSLSPLEQGRQLHAQPAVAEVLAGLGATAADGISDPATSGSTSPSIYCASPGCCGWRAGRGACGPVPPRGFVVYPGSKPSTRGSGTPGCRSVPLAVPRCGVFSLKDVL
jgi:hypothetical protein